MTAPPSPWHITDLPPSITGRITIDEISRCWRVSGNHDRDGYARIGGEGAHRVIYRLLVGPIPPDRPQLDHVVALGCRWRDCGFPGHLEPVTARINTMRGTSFAAVNAAKDECIHGHAFDLLNCYFRPDGSRDCRKCTARRQREYQQRLRQQAPDATLPLLELGRAA